MVQQQQQQQRHSLQLPRFENPRGLLGLGLIIAFSFLVSGLLKRKGDAILRKKGKHVHPAVRFFSAYSNIEGMLYGAAAVFGFIVLLGKSRIQG